MIRWQRCRIRIQVRSNSPGDGDTNTQTQRSAVTQLCVGVCDHARRAQPCSSSCVHRGALKYWAQRDGTVWAWWDFSASQSFWLWGIELQSTQQCPEQQGCRACQQHLPTSSNTTSGPITSARTAIPHKCSFPAPLCPLKHTLSEQPLSPSQSHSWGGISSLHFHFCSLFHPSDEDSDSDSDWRTKHQSSVKGRWSSTFLFAECTANWNIPSFQPLSTSQFMESPEHRQGSDVEKETIPSAMKHSLTSYSRSGQTTQLNSLLPLSTQHIHVLSKWEQHF